MRDNIVDFLSLFFLNLMGFLTVLITSFLSPFILMWDFIKYIFLNKKQYSVFSLSVKELLVSLGTLILFFVFLYFYKRFWYLFFLLPLLLGLLESTIELIFKNQGTFISKILDHPTLCGTPFIQMEEESDPKEKPIHDNRKPLSREEEVQLFERMGFKRKNILKHLDEKQ